MDTGGFDLKERIDSSFGDGPDHRPVADRLTAGRTAARRRRAAASLAVVVTAGILGTTGWALIGGPSAPANVATSTDTHPLDLPAAPVGTVYPGCVLDLSTTPPSPQASDADATSATCGGQSPPILFLDGTLYRSDPSVVVDDLIQPAGPDGGRSAAAVVEVGGKTEWVFTQANHGSSATIEAPATDGQTFAQWAVSGPKVLIATAPPGDTNDGNDGNHQPTSGSTEINPDPISPADSPVKYDGSGTLVAKAGSTIVQTIADPTVSDAAVPAGADATAVVVTQDGKGYFVLGYITPAGDSDLFTEPAGSRADTLATWLALVKAAQDGGGGVR
jgi:hypothetical protein